MVFTNLFIIKGEKCAELRHSQLRHLLVTLLATKQNSFLQSVGVLSCFLSNDRWDLSAGFPILYQVNAFYDRTRNAICKYPS